MKVKITEAFIRSNKTARGAWTKEQLRILGVPWPPRKGWVLGVVGKEIDDETAAAFSKAKTTMAYSTLNFNKELFQKRLAERRKKTQRRIRCANCAYCNGTGAQP